MKSKQAAILLVIALLGILFINATTKSKQQKSYEYISIYYDVPRVTINKGKEHYESYRLSEKKRKGKYDTREIFRLIEKFEKEGYELIESNACSSGEEFSSPVSYYLLRK